MRGRNLVGLALVCGAFSCGVVTHDQVAMGASRLTMRNIGAVTTLINADTTCGFSSTNALMNADASAAVGQRGTLTWRISECAIELNDAVVSTDCQGKQTKATGKIVVTATKSIDGIITGDAETPVIPGAADAATFKLEKVAFTNFEVKVSDSDASLLMENGEISATVKPLLAVNASTGACAIASPNVTFEDVRYAPSQLKVHSEGREIFVQVKSSSLKGQNGVRDGRENALEGSITLAARFPYELPHPTRETAIPVFREEGTLDPEYESAKFLESWTCAPDLVVPPAFQCADLRPRLADGAARLTVKLFGTLASILNRDHACGFLSHSVVDSAVIVGNTGESGSATQTLGDCSITYRTNTQVTPNCLGQDTLLTGTMTATGTKIVTGELTGNPETPALPETDNPATLDLTFTFDNFRLGLSGSPNALIVRRGTLHGVLEPRTARAQSNGYCSITTPIAQFANLQWANAELAVVSENGTIDVAVATSSLNATNGSWMGVENALDGTITVDGEVQTVPSDGAGLDPMYDAVTFASSWECAQNLELPVSYVCGP